MNTLYNIAMLLFCKMMGMLH